MADGNRDVPAVRPLGEAQFGLWYAQRLEPDNPAFNTAHALWIDGPLDRAAFRTAADRLATESEALALAMRLDAEGPRQWIDPARRPLLEQVDASAGRTPEQAEAFARAAMQQDMLRPVDPVRDRLAAQTLFRLGDQRHVWYLRVHHLATDGYGMELLAARLTELYAAQRQGREAAPGFAPLRGVLDEDAAYRASARREDDARYWRDYLAGMPEAAGLAPGRAVAAHACLRHTLALPDPLRQRLLQRAGSGPATWADWLSALTALYCQRMSGGEEFIVGAPFMGRLGSAAARVPAMVMNVLPLRVAASADAPLDEFVNQVARELTRARRHGRYRSEQLRRDLGLLGGQRRLHGPLVNVQPYYRPLTLDGVQTRLEILGTGPVDDLALGFRGDGVGRLDLEIEANPTLYAPEAVSAHAERLAAFLAAALDAERIDDIPLATAAEAQRHLFDLNATAHPVADVTLSALLEAALARDPQAEALVFGETSLSYAELERRSRALAATLQARGIGPEAIVAVALPRSLELVIALIAILRAGAAYLPLDLDHPPQRLARILDSADPACILIQRAQRDLLPGNRDLLACEDWPADSDAALCNPPQPHHAAYVIYTSGSTGEPKGVLVEHRAIVNRLQWMRSHYGFDAGDRILQKTPMSFDVSVWEFFLAFLAGGTLVVAPPQAHRDPQAIAALIRRQRISTVHFVPSMLAAFLADPGSAGLTLRRVFCSGEELTADLRDRFHATVQAELHNLYGPTEAAVDVSYWPASADDDSQPVPIGHPVWNTRLYVLDARMRALPPGVVGDLYLGGVQLARGYLGQPALTAERFIDDPFLPGQRLYRTGDLARWREDGVVVFLGRSDHQVKLRGLRIELGEIEAAIVASGRVRHCGVIVREDRRGERRLVAYLQWQGGMGDLQALRAEVAARVPDYMVPAAFVALDHWPLTGNGKLDRKALPAPQFVAAAAVPLRGEREHGIAELFAELLDVEGEIGADADFFSLGGDSLLAVELLLRIQQRWQRNPGLGALFAHPSVAALARLIDAEQAADDGLAPLLRLHDGDPALDPLFVIHPAGGIAWCYRTLARSLSPARSVYGLQAAALEPAQPLPRGIDALAAEYARRIVEVRPDGVLHLAGWSVGGILAQAIAVQLQAQGRRVGLVALLDAYPSECWRDESEPTPAQALRALLAVAGHDPEQLPELDSREAIIDFLRRSDSALGNLPPAVLEGVIRVVTQTNRLIRQHRHQRYAGDLLHIRAGLDHTDKPRLQAGMWQAHATGVEQESVPCLHGQMTGRDAVARIAPMLDQRLRRHDDLARKN
ncbi:MAG: amino acid adenylation domain-containing protein [Lysobacteraceae bacterium]